MGKNLSILAYYVVWTCYGQWLRGDARGYVDRERNIRGTPYSGPDNHLFTADSNRMSEDVVNLSAPQRQVVAEILQEACAFRGWRLHVANVQPDHIHLVVSADNRPGYEVRRLLKSRAAQEMNRRLSRRKHWWTDGGKIELIRSEAQLRRVILYVENQKFPPP